MRLHGRITGPAGPPGARYAGDKAGTAAAGGVMGEPAPSPQTAAPTGRYSRFDYTMYYISYVE